MICWDGDDGDASIPRVREPGGGLPSTLGWRLPSDLPKETVAESRQGLNSNLKAEKDTRGKRGGRRERERERREKEIGIAGHIFVAQ